ncbi:MAG: Gfo/Idh/MocA family protein [Phycisphaerae bacterium]
MPIRWGIIGCGDVCEVKSGPAFQNVPDSQLVAVMRRDAAKAADYARRHEVPRWTAHTDEIIQADDVDAVYIATPVGSHAEYALAVAAAGKPCYVEKPMARNVTECRRMVDAFQAVEQKLFVAYYRRGLDRFIRSRDLIAQGRLGQVTSVHYRYARRWDDSRTCQLPWRVDAALAGGGFVMDLGCHLLDILDFLLGPIGKVSGLAVNLAGSYSVEDNVVMHMQFADGPVGTCAWNFASDQPQDLIEICGTEGQLRLSCFGNEPVELRRGDAIETFALPNPKHIQQPLIHSIVDDLLGRGDCPSTGVSAERTSRVLDDVLESYYGCRSDAFWDRPETWPGRPQG